MRPHSSYILSKEKDKYNCVFTQLNFTFALCVSRSERVVLHLPFIIIYENLNGFWPSKQKREASARPINQIELAMN